MLPTLKSPKELLVIVVWFKGHLKGGVGQKTNVYSTVIEPMDMIDY